MGNDICNCNGPYCNKNQSALDSALRKEEIVPFQNKAKYSSKHDKSIEIKTNNNENNKESISKSENNDNHEMSIKNLTMINNVNISITNKLEEQFTLIPQLRDHLISKDDENNMYKLCISSRNEKDISLLFDNKYNKFNFCNTLNIIHCDTSLIYKNMHNFIRLKHLEIYKPEIKRQQILYKELYKIINLILDKLSVHLISFKFEGCIKYSYSYIRCGDNLPILNIPNNIEWLTLKNIGCDIDISKCHKLIGLQLLQNMKYQQIIWPKTDDLLSKKNYNLIPYAALCDGRGIKDNQWTDKCIKNQLNIKYICLLKEKAKFINDDNKEKKRNGFKNGKDIMLQTEIGYNDNTLIEKYKLDLNDERKCIILNDFELNSGDLYQKIMRYKFKDDIKLKSQKIMQYDDCLWIKKIGDLKYF